MNEQTGNFPWAGLTRGIGRRHLDNAWAPLGAAPPCPQAGGSVTPPTLQIPEAEGLPMCPDLSSWRDVPLGRSERKESHDFFAQKSPDPGSGSGPPRLLAETVEAEG